uniref:Calcium homeostasis endoplasmic reticulum protein n=1 Tax=Bactrocera latifrons TaxID=174628 RepID=A0A0K8UWC1_BACLA
MTQPNSAGNFFIPDLSKPPPGFSGGANAAVNPLPLGLQQPFAQINNIPHTGNNSSGVGAGNIDGANLKAAGSNIDVLALNAAIQLVLKQQNQQLQNSQQNVEGTVQHLAHTDLSTNVPPLTQAQMPPQHMLDNEEVTTGQMAVMTPQTEAEETKPSAPYYDLPAGLMVPLIRLDDYNYKPLDPADIRLPPPAPQSERLTNALAAFYAPPTHDRPRDTYAFILIFHICICIV